MRKKDVSHRDTEGTEMRAEKKDDNVDFVRQGGQNQRLLSVNSTRSAWQAIFAM